MHKLVTKRDPKFTNFIEVTLAPAFSFSAVLLLAALGCLDAHSPPPASLTRCSLVCCTLDLPQFRRYKVIYRRYAGEAVVRTAEAGQRSDLCSRLVCSAPPSPCVHSLSSSDARVAAVLSGLYFSFCLDMNDNELAYLESIHLFVELLDKFFASVCELDLVFNFHKIYSILDEIFLGGEIQETSKRVILERLEELNKLE